MNPPFYLTLLDKARDDGLPEPAIVKSMIALL
jgi:hypothetical protein